MSNDGVSMKDVQQIRFIFCEKEMTSARHDRTVLFRMSLRPA